MEANLIPYMSTKTIPSMQGWVVRGWAKITQG